MCLEGNSKVDAALCDAALAAARSRVRWRVRRLGQASAGTSDDAVGPAVRALWRSGLEHLFDETGVPQNVREGYVRQLDVSDRQDPLTATWTEAETAEGGSGADDRALFLADGVAALPSLHAPEPGPNSQSHSHSGLCPHPGSLLGMVGVCKCEEDSEEGRVAAVLLEESAATAASIHRLTVAEEARGCGLGGALLRAAEAFADSAGAACVLAQVGSPSARSFYRHLGYEQMDGEMGEQCWFYRHLGGHLGGGSKGSTNGHGTGHGPGLPAVGGEQAPRARHPSNNPLLRQRDTGTPP